MTYDDPITKEQALEALEWLADIAYKARAPQVPRFNHSLNLKKYIRQREEEIAKLKAKLDKDQNVLTK